MEVKKSPKSNLENKKVVFFEIGMIISLAVLLLAFEWRSTADEVSSYDIPAEDMIEEEIIPITMQNTAPPPPPPPPKLIDLIDIVDDDMTIEDELEIIDIEDQSENTEQTISDFSGEFGTEDTGEDEIFQIVEQQPQFPHGDVRAWLAKNVNYPSIAAEMGIQGTIYLQFVIEKDGSITDIKVVKGVDAILEKEAVRVVKSMPNWIPGKQRGKAVRVQFTLPISFKLQQF